MSFVNHRDNSRINWGLDVAGKSNPDRSVIELGCLLRIADSTEAMAKHHNDLIRERDYLARRSRELLAENEFLKRQRSALRGTITRMKRRSSHD